MMNHKRVLIVDDDRAILQMLEHSLKSLGPDYDITTVETVMSHEVETIIPDIPVSAAILIMLDKGVDRLVIQHAKPAPQWPVGVLSLSDVIRDMAGND